ncbi:hypothetical protein PC128_g21643 [Phytophthora cactorum]|nr:hypothetical protein PC128_g21643 [Phytophthora cactorum]
MLAAPKFRVPIVSFLNVVGNAVRKEVAASSTPAGDLFRSGGLEVVDIPLPTLPDQNSGGPLLVDPKGNLPQDKQEIRVEWVQGTYVSIEQYMNQLLDGQKTMSTEMVPKFTLTRAGRFLPQVMGQYVFGNLALFERKILEGLGDIRQGVGTMLRGAGYKVLGFKRRVTPEQEHKLAACADHVTSDLSEVLSQSDYLVNVLPSSSFTRYLLNENNLGLCRERKPVFINIGRGDVVAEKTIIDALDNDMWSRVVLDVFEDEPLPRHCALWAHPSVLVTPHVAGYPFAEGAASIFVDNFNRYLRGEQMLCKMDWTAGY